MRRLIRLLAGRRADGERGAVLVLTALIVMFVAIGMLAVTIDLGNITYNRAELQNGADAGALSLATACASSSGGDTSCGVTTKITTLAEDNASATNQSMEVLTNDQTCINDIGANYVADHDGVTNLPLCASDPTTDNPTALSKCQPWPLTQSASAMPYVEVTTQTKMVDGTNVLPFYFAQILGAGNGSTSETCSRAAWGNVKKAPIKAPITISACQWKEETNNGTNYVPDGPVYNNGGPGGGDYGYGGEETPWPSPDREIVVSLHDPSDSLSSCDWNGKQTAGGFGYIGDKKTCSVTVTDNWAPINTGANPPNCILTGQVLEMPIFDCIVSSSDAPTGPPPSSPADVCDPTNKNGGGSKTWYHIAGYAKFYVSGTSLTGNDTGSVMPGGHTSCGGNGNSGRCIMGWFLQGTIDDATEIDPPGGGDDFGVHAILPAG